MSTAAVGGVGNGVQRNQNSPALEVSLHSRANVSVLADVAVE
jgi:hypothetical protein